MSTHPESLKPIRVFCASPGDVTDAREAVQEIVAQLDQIWRDRGVALEFDGWEDTGPSGGRPQDEINELVDGCDVFVGLLNGRWGFPTGKYKSGFEEEYKRALARYQAEEAPELCVYFTKLSSRDSQMHLVEEFRQRLERTQEAYYRSFENLDGLRELVHRRVERYLTSYLNLGNAEQRPAELNWDSVLSSGAVGQIPDGLSREQEAADKASHDPAGAAVILERLAVNLEANDDLRPSAQQLLEEAATLKQRAGDTPAAVTALMSLLRVRVSAGSELARANAHTLRQWLPQDAQWIADTWEAALTWPEHPEDSVAILRTALGHDEHELVTNEDRYAWQEQLAEILLQGNDKGAPLVVLEGLPDLAADSVDVMARLHCLAAEAAEFAGDARKAEDMWDRLLAAVDDHGEGWPVAASVVHARRAVGLVRHERLAGAQREFLKSAQRWAEVKGAAGEVAEQYFNASVAADLLGEFSSRPDFNRAQAVNVRSTKETPERAAEQLLHRGVETRITGHAFDAINPLTLAAQIHRRAGHLRGELHATRLLGELFEHAGEHAAALTAAVACGQRDQALRLAPLVSPEDLPGAIDLQGPIWVRRTSLSALGVAGRRLKPDDASAIASVVLDAAQAPVASSAERDRQVAAIEAAAALVFEWPEDTRGAVVELLSNAAASQNFLLASPAVQALILRTNAGQGDHLDELIEVMLDGNTPGQPVSAGWVASQLRDRPDVIDRLSQAGAANNLAAIETLATSEHVDQLDKTVVVVIETRIQEFLSTPLGHTPEGHIIGFLRLEPWGSLAARVPDEALREQVAQALIDFVLNDDEPHANRASGANALHNLAPALTSGLAASLLDRLRPVAEGNFGSSLYDLPPEVAHHPLNRFRLGDEAAADRLQAAALTASTRLNTVANTDTPWLAEAIDQALASDEPLVVAGAWEAIWRSKAIPLPDALTLHLAHPAHQVRIQVLTCWRIRRKDAPPTRTAERLMRDDNVNVRLTLLGLLRDGDRNPGLRAAMATNDHDAYVRAGAAMPLQPEPESSAG